MKKIIILLIVLTLSSCNRDNLKIKYLDVSFLEKGTSTNIRVDCEFLKGNWDGLLHNKTIKNSKFLKEFELQYSNYSLYKSEINIDVRIKVLIYFNNNKIDTLCLGEFFNTSINNKPMIDNPHLLQILKQELKYNNSISKKSLQLQID